MRALVIAALLVVLLSSSLGFMLREHEPTRAQRAAALLVAEYGNDDCGCTASTRAHDRVADGSVAREKAAEASTP